MAFKLPGPVCSFLQTFEIDTGTMCRTQSPVPGVVQETGTRRAPRHSGSRTLCTSELGLAFIFSIEVGPLVDVTAHFHWPGGSSGVTLGPGYDMKERKKVSVAEDLRRIGLPAETAIAAAEGAGLHGHDAKKFCEDNEDLVDLDKKTQIALLKIVVPHYEHIVRRNVHIALAQYQFDALVCFVYNPGGSFRPVAHMINSGELEKAADLMRTRVLTGGKKAAGLVNRRMRETKLFLHGVY